MKTRENNLQQKSASVFKDISLCIKIHSENDLKGMCKSIFRMSHTCHNSLFMDRGGKLLLTQVGSLRYSIQDDGVLSLFELCEHLKIILSQNWPKKSCPLSCLYCCLS